MKRLQTFFTALLVLGITSIPLLGQEDNDKPGRRSKTEGFLRDTRFVGIFNTYNNDLTGLQVGLASNMLLGNLSGIQAAGFANVTEGTTTGIQAAGLANVTGGMMTGVQAAGFANISGGSATGAQFSFLSNIAGDGAGVQLTGLVNVSGGGAILQAAGLANVAADEYSWGQFSGLTNVAAGGSAIQLSGLANVTAGEKSLIQAAGIVNVSEGTAAVQTAGIANVAGESAWGQIGGVNVTPEARLVQIGILNIAAKNSGLPLGVVNIIGDNPLRLSIMVDGYGQATTAVRSGNKHIYSVAGFQGGEDMRLERLGNLLMGIGLNMPLNRAYLSAEYLYNQRIDTWDQREGIVGLRAGFRVSWDVALVAGASVRWNDITAGNATDGLSQGWSIGLEWFRPIDFGMSSNMDFDLDF